VTKRAVLVAAGGLLGVGLFSLVMSLLAENDRWPQLPPGALHNVDLVAGFAVAVALVLVLALKRGSAS
jgi:hypothetical protein